MAHITPWILLLAIAGFLIIAGCSGTAPGTPPGTVAVGSVPSGATTAMTPALTTPEAVTTVPVMATTVPAAVTTSPALPSQQQVYYGNLAIFMDRQKYAFINFEDFGFPYLKPGDQFIVRITSDHAIFAYVINTADVPLVKNGEGIPVFNTFTREYEYGKLFPLLKLEDVYEGGGNFTVKDLGKYTLVLDTRLAEQDYRLGNEAAKVAVRIIRLG